MAIIETYKGPSFALSSDLLKKKFVFFDFDGVIVDSFAPAFEVSKIICPSSSEEDYRRKFEGNINDWQQSEFLHDDKCRHDVDFPTEYLPRLRVQVRLFPGIDEVISTLAKSYTLIIISSTFTAPIQELLERYNLLSYFTEIMGNDVHKSKVEKIKMVFDKYNAKNTDCIFITDTLGDMREASHTEVATIGVSWGFHMRETLMQGKPFKIVESPNDLVSTVYEYFK